MPQDFSDEEMARDWTLSEADKKEVNRYRTNSRLFIAIQLCAVRLYGRFLLEVNDLSPRIVSYLNSQLELPPSLTINTPDRDATFSEQRKNILTYLGSVKGTCVTGSDERAFSACCEIQGLPSDFDVPFFTLEGKKQAVANGVPLALGRYVARLVASTLYGAPVTEIPSTGSQRRCACGCGRVVVGRARYHSATCRKRAQRAREAV